MRSGGESDKHLSTVMFNLYEATPNNLPEYWKAPVITPPRPPSALYPRGSIMDADRPPFMCLNPLSYTERKLRATADPVHIHSEFLRPYLARQLGCEEKRRHHLSGRRLTCAAQNNLCCLIETQACNCWKLLIYPDPECCSIRAEH